MSSRAAPSLDTRAGYLRRGAHRPGARGRRPGVRAADAPEQRAPVPGHPVLRSRRGRGRGADAADVRARLHPAPAVRRRRPVLHLAAPHRGQRGAPAAPAGTPLAPGRTRRPGRGARHARHRRDSRAAPRPRAAQPPARAARRWAPGVAPLGVRPPGGPAALDRRGGRGARAERRTTSSSASRGPRRCSAPLSSSTPASPSPSCTRSRRRGAIASSPVSSTQLTEGGGAPTGGDA